MNFVYSFEFGFFSSSLIQKILCDAHKAKIQFRVVIVDGRPWLEGKELLRRLSKVGIECSYVLINALSFIMPEVSCRKIVKTLLSIQNLKQNINLTIY